MTIIVLWFKKAQHRPCCSNRRTSESTLSAYSCKYCQKYNGSRFPLSFGSRWKTGCVTEATVNGTSESTDSCCEFPRVIASEGDNIVSNCVTLVGRVRTTSSALLSD